MTGTEKQIKWAKDIIEGWKNHMNSQIEDNSIYQAGTKKVALMVASLKSNDLYIEKEVAKVDSDTVISIIVSRLMEKEASLIISLKHLNANDIVKIFVDKALI